MKSQSSFIPRKSLQCDFNQILAVAETKALSLSKSALHAHCYRFFAHLQISKQLSKWEMLALIHIYRCTFASNQPNCWIPFPATAIDKLSTKNACMLRDALQTLMDKSLIEPLIYNHELGWTYDSKARKCKCYRLAPNLSEHLFHLLEPQQVFAQPLISLNTGQEYTTQLEHKLEDMSPLQAKAASCFQPFLIDLDSLYRYINNPSAYLEKTKEHHPGLNLEDITQSARNAQLNDETAYRALIKHIDPDMTAEVHQREQEQKLCAIRACYSSTSTGRFADAWGAGFLSLSREAKAAALDPLPHDFRVYNYDIISSQLTLFRELLRTANLSYEVVNEFIAIDKSTRAKRIGIPVKVYKQCLYAWIFGGSLSLYNLKKSEEQLRKCNQKIVNYILDSVGYQGFKQSYQQLYDELELLQSCRQALMSYILTQEGWQKLGGTVNRQTVNLTNAAGKIFDAKHYVKPRQKDFQTIELKSKQSNEFWRKLFAHILQGLESALMHRLTILATEAGIPIYLNQHDGLISGKPIPNALFEQAVAEFNVQNLQFEIKSIA